MPRRLGGSPGGKVQGEETGEAEDPCSGTDDALPDLKVCLKLEPESLILPLIEGMRRYSTMGMVLDLDKIRALLSPFK